MQLRDMPTDELRRALSATERAAGQDSDSARVLRRELAQRERAQVTTTTPTVPSRACQDPRGADPEPHGTARGRAMMRGMAIDPGSVYNDGDLILGLGLTHATLARARRTGALRFARPGQRPLYLGRWVIAWLEASAQPAASQRQRQKVR
jgi:hypothetical protein